MAHAAAGIRSQSRACPTSYVRSGLDPGAHFGKGFTASRGTGALSLKRKDNLVCHNGVPVQRYLWKIRKNIRFGTAQILALDSTCSITPASNDNGLPGAPSLSRPVRQGGGFLSQPNDPPSSSEPPNRRVAGPLAHLISLPQPKPWVPRPFDSAQGRLLRFVQGRERYCRYNRA